MKKLTGPKLMVGIPNICADILYVSGFKASDPVVFLENGRQRHLVVSRMEIGRARAANPRLEVLAPEDLKLPRAQHGRVACWAAALLRKVNLRKVNVSGTFPLQVARTLERQGVHVTVSKHALCPEREIKNPGEIAHMARVQRAAIGALREALHVLADARVDARRELRIGKQVLTSEDLRKLINRTLLEANCAGGEPIVAGGPLSANPHWIGYGPLKAGEPIVFDIFPQDLETGYWGDLTRTVVKGRPSARLQRMFDAVKVAQAEALGLIRSGARTDAIHRRVVERFEALGFAQRVTNGIAEGFIHGTGHGVGLEIHESPSLGRTPSRLRAGQVVTVEPGLYYTDLGGIRIEDTVVVTPDGFEYLATCPKRLTIP